MYDAQRLRHPDDITPNEFELLVKSWFDGVGGALENFEVLHREVIDGQDGAYEIDVSIRFRALAGAAFLVLAECKKHKNPIKREVVQVLQAKVRSAGAQKGIVISTTDFQEGAKVYAQKHGIALVRVVSGAMRYIQASLRGQCAVLPPGWPVFVGLIEFAERDGAFPIGFVGIKDPDGLRALLGVRQ